MDGTSSGIRSSLNIRKDVAKGESSHKCLLGFPESKSKNVVQFRKMTCFNHAVGFVQNEKPQTLQFFGQGLVLKNIMIMQRRDQVHNALLL